MISLEDFIFFMTKKSKNYICIEINYAFNLILYLTLNNIVPTI